MFSVTHQLRTIIATKLFSMEGKSDCWGFNINCLWNADVEEYLSISLGPENFSQICCALSKPPLYSCLRVNTIKCSVESILKEVQGFSQTQDEDHGESSSSSELHKYVSFEHPVLKNVVMVSGSGPHAVQYKKTDDSPLKEVVVSRKCAESVLRGAQVFVPGVFATSSHLEKGDEVGVSVALEIEDGENGWTPGFTRGAILGSTHALEQKGNQDRNSLFIGKGKAAMSRTEIFRESKGIAVEMTERVFDLPPCNNILKGKVFLQNLPSIVAARVLDPRPGERILDMCAAPGGKTTAIATLMENKGEVIALDRSHNKVDDIKALAKELGLSCIKAYKMNSLKAVLENKEDVTRVESPVKLPENPEGQGNRAPTKTLEVPPKQESGVGEGFDEGGEIGAMDKNKSYQSRREERKAKRRMRNGPEKPLEWAENCAVKGFKKQSFDRVLLDAPCSALGLRPRLFAANITLEELRKHAVYQKRLFDQAVQLVRPGGVLVYSTCTINPGENEGLVRYALDKYPFLSLSPQDPVLGGPGLVGGLNVFDGVGYREWLRPQEANLVQRFDPSSSLDTIGFFIAKFIVSP